MRRCGSSTLALAGLVMTCSALAAGGSPDDAASAEALFRDARALIADGDYPAACPKLAESLRLDHAPGTLLSLADCEEHTSRVATAWAHFRELSRELPSSDERQPFAVQRATALEPRLPHLTIRSSNGFPPGAKIWRDDIEIARASLDMALPVDPGTHTVVVSEGDRVICHVEVEVREGQSGVLAPESVEHEDRSPIGQATRTAGWVTGGIGVTALAAGTYFGVLALSSRSASDPGCTSGPCADAASARAHDDAQTQARIAEVALGVGIAATAVAGYLILFASRRSDARPVSAPASHSPLALLTRGELTW